MSKLYDVAILGEDRFESWFLAAALARLDLRVVLILREPPDPDLPCFFHLPLDPSRAGSLTEPFQLAPRASSSPVYVPDCQVIIAGRAFDFTADPDQRKRQLARDFQELSPRFQELADDLRQMAADEMSKALEQGFPEIFLPAARASLLGWLKSKTKREEKPMSIGEWAGKEPAPLPTLFMALASAGLGLPLTLKSPAIQLALYWELVHGLSSGPGSDLDFREQAATLIARRGLILEAAPDALIVKGKTVASIRLKGGSIVDTRTLVAPVKRIYHLLNEDPDPVSDASLRSRVQLISFFFRIEKTAIPESLSDRAVVVHDPAQELSGENLMILVRGPRTPARETLCVTMLAPLPELEPGQVPARLARSLPWLRPDLISVDETREPITLSLPSAGGSLFKSFSPRLPLDNALPHPAEVLPFWGPLGLGRTLKSMLNVLSEMIKKSKGLK